ncbi:DNA-binding response regulator [Thalassobacillus devorans]|uniref:DNA-binding response regulator n=1 Tax=Thalassobacillus devorans TaxID=279813 RepID=A0ABQ1NUQ1_9BACI|nr:response regulator transcription factor [Thalassobacillus devorans]NIK28583.1 two-component system response regulator YesN [Thalassobacillus devorans]GGC85095.1 DNA-binding response regulator [Thalassobacillus devorans]
MINVMLVDDEPLIVEGMQNIIDWEAYGFKVTAAASNGKEAYAKIQEIKVDVLITDIQMPEMTGLELIEAVKEKNPSVRSIVLTGFREFHLIKKGLNLGIENYLLKPINEEELVSSLLHIKEKLSHSMLQEESELVLRDHAIWRWMQGKMNEEECIRRLSLYPDIQLEPEYAIALLKIDWEGKAEDLLRKTQSNLESETSAVCVLTPMGDLLLLWSYYDELDSWKGEWEHVEQVLERYDLASELVSAHQTGITSIGSIPEIYRELERHCELKLLLPEEDHQLADELYSDYFINQVHDLKRSSNFLRPELLEQLANREFQNVINSMEQLLDYFEKQLQTLMLKSILLELFYHIKNNFFIPLEYEDYVTMVHEIMSTETKEDGVEVLKKCIKLIDHPPVKEREYSPIIETVLQYIHQNYSEDLSLKTLGHQFHVNSIYLGQLFQKEVSSSFTKYLNRIRIERAKQYLQNSHEKAGSIGKKVGYADATYFYKQFKKLEDVTPTEWRHQHK